jgi:phage gp36-like protein
MPNYIDTDYIYSHLSSAQVAAKLAGSTLDAATVINTLIEDACAVVDSYLPGDYNLPFGETPAFIRLCAFRIFACLLDQRSGVVAERILSDYKEAIAMLSALKNGQQSLTASDGASVSEFAPPVVRIATPSEKTRNFINKLAY